MQDMVSGIDITVYLTYFSDFFKNAFTSISSRGVFFFFLTCSLLIHDSKILDWVSQPPPSGLPVHQVLHKQEIWWGGTENPSTVQSATAVIVFLTITCDGFQTRHCWPEPKRLLTWYNETEPQTHNRLYSCEKDAKFITWLKYAIFSQR